MDVLQAIILGIVEGATEFLPVSSTGHLIVVSQWLGIEQTKINIAFEVIIQLAAILAIFANYKDKFTVSHLNLWIKILIAFLPLAIVGFIFKDQIEALFLSKIVVPIMFIIGGIVFLVLEFFHKESHEKMQNIDEVSYQQAAWIGFAQIFALVPGTSRAGSTIVGALLVGLSRKASAEFSFLLALPVMGATSAYAFLKHYNDFMNANWIPLAVGFATAFIVAYLTMKIFIRFLEKFTFVSFGVYRILFGSFLLYLGSPY
jgi:undecaprenyl-diphosphatase